MNKGHLGPVYFSGSMFRVMIQIGVLLCSTLVVVQGPLVMFSHLEANSHEGYITERLSCPQGKGSILV